LFQSIIFDETKQKNQSSKKKGLEESAHAVFLEKQDCSVTASYRQGNSTILLR
jgi:hypothetical protein